MSNSTDALIHDLAICGATPGGIIAAVAAAVGRESRDTYGESLAGIRFIESNDEVERYHGTRSVDPLFPIDPYGADGRCSPASSRAKTSFRGRRNAPTSSHPSPCRPRTSPSAASASKPSGCPSGTPPAWQPQPPLQTGRAVQEIDVSRLQQTLREQGTQLP